MCSLAVIVAAQYQKGVGFNAASARYFDSLVSGNFFLHLWLNITFDALTAFFPLHVSVITEETGVDWHLSVTSLVLMICLHHLTHTHYCLFFGFCLDVAFINVCVCVCVCVLLKANQSADHESSKATDNTVFKVVKSSFTSHTSSRPM